ncbi:hypothetical protein [Flavobacterium sp. 245]|uniref:hypothetical protein n=1 Tax=Flavobacterium sp. 245 TaxID=2512115 RepID=UPI0010D413C2|nr:hypothetical protein [Flavobacterium sp. 245]TDO94902.1 hypothetical protein EV145_11626 [Flavobacterium sp. 245]
MKVLDAELEESKSENIAILFLLMNSACNAKKALLGRDIKSFENEYFNIAELKL